MVNFVFEKCKNEYETNNVEFNAMDGQISTVRHAMFDANE